MGLLAKGAHTSRRGREDVWVRVWPARDLVGFLQILAPLCLSISGQGQLGLGPCVALWAVGLSLAQSGVGRDPVGGLEPRVHEMEAGSPSALGRVVGVRPSGRVVPSAL